jgi:hypothetical protein
MPLAPVKAEFNNYFDNWKCLHDFGASCLNQQFVCRNAAVAGSNDSGYTVEPDGDGSLPGVRVVFFPELGWLRGGQGHALRDRIERSLVDGYMGGDRADWWDRRKRNAFGRLTLRKGPWE